jgi:hypothetical protein
MADAGAVAASCRIDAADVAGRLEQARKDEVVRALEAEFGDLPWDWRRGLAGFRRAFDGKWIEVAGEIAAGILRGRRPNGGEIQRETGIPRRTVDYHLAGMQASIEGFFGGDDGPEGGGAGE